MAKKQNLKILINCKKNDIKLGRGPKKLDIAKKIPKDELED